MYPQRQGLEAWHEQSAYMSGGTSNEPIYQIFERIIQHYRLNGHILDFGSGTGNLTRRLIHLGLFDSITGIDLMPRPSGLPDSVQWWRQDLNLPTEFSEASFDVIVSAEVIEHLENPRAVAREWFRLLKSGGLLLLSTPNNESWRSIAALIFRGHYAHFGDTSYPAHITALLRKDVARIMREAGFAHISFYFTDCGTVPKLGKMRWQSISWGLLKGLRYSDNILAVAWKQD